MRARSCRWPTSSDRRVEVIVQLVIVAVIVAVTIGVAIASRRVGGDAAPTPSGFTVPGRGARNDFEHPERPWLVAVFTSETCDSCAGVVERAAPLDSPEVAVAAVPVQDQAETHAKYRIDGVPTTIIADAHGTKLFDLFPAPRIGRKAESVGADHHAWMHDTTGAQHTVFPDRDAGLDHRVSTDAGPPLPLIHI